MAKKSGIHNDLINLLTLLSNFYFFSLRMEIARVINYMKGYGNGSLPTGSAFITTTSPNPSELSNLIPQLFSASFSDNSLSITDHPNET